MTTRETLVKELEQLNTAIDFNSKQGLKLLSEYAGVGTVVANKEMIFFEDDHARLLRRRDAVLRSLEAIPD
ncbi:hypothetical protein [Tunturiibacter gelidiferens]|uniref:Uncharacterized protein n=1 Tax=Tunturiibacter gelidiferens TaxID=3069689 RepID=A0AAU7Z021_9BACT